MNTLDILFLSKTHCNVDVLDVISGFTKFGDKNFPLIQKHAGLAVYVRGNYAQYVKEIRYGRSSISLSINTIPNFFFMGVYIYPTDSFNYNDTDFGGLISDMNYWLMKGYHPIVGGDFNSRVGNINEISKTSLDWKYQMNVDSVINENGKRFATMCEFLKIQPINHCNYRTNLFRGGFTYF